MLLVVVDHVVGQFAEGVSTVFACSVAHCVLPLFVMYLLEVLVDHFPLGIMVTVIEWMSSFRDIQEP